MRAISISASLRLSRVASLLAALFLWVAPPALAQPKAIAAGLWENKASSPELDAARAQMNAQMANMPAAQRAQMEKMMSGNGAMMSKDGATKVCITAEMAKADPSAGATPEGCKQNLIWSGNTARMDFSCKDGAQGRGEFVYASDKAYSGWIESQGKSTKISRMTISAKWLADDCGTVKPIKR